MNNYNRQLINDDESFKLKNVIIIVVIIMFVLVSFYFITKYVLEHKKDNTPTVESVIDREKIIFGQMFNKSDNEYYVIAYNSDEKSKEIYNKYIEKYGSKENSIKIYEIDLKDDFNKSYIANKSNITSNLDELKVSGDTLFKIKDKTIEEYKEGSNDISNYLKEISA